MKRVFRRKRGAAHRHSLRHVQFTVYIQYIGGPAHSAKRKDFFIKDGNRTHKSKGMIYDNTKGNHIRKVIKKGNCKAKVIAGITH